MKRDHKFLVCFSLISVLTMALTIAVYDAASQSTSSPAPTLSMISAKPGPPVAKVYIGETLQFIAVGTYSDGSSEDIASKVNWTISNPTVASISDSGLVEVIPVSISYPYLDYNIADSGTKIYVSASLSGVTSEPWPITVFTKDGPAAYYQTGGRVDYSNLTIIASKTNQSGVKVTDGGHFNFSDSMITTFGGNTPGIKAPGSVVGLNAGVMAKNGAKIRISNCMITTTGQGTVGVLAHGEGSQVEMKDIKIRATGGNAVNTTWMGSIIVQDADIYTKRDGLANDSGDGAITANRVKVYVDGPRAAIFYAIGENSMYKITDSTLFAAKGGLMTSGATVTLTNDALSAINVGVQCSGGELTITGGSMTVTDGDAFVIEYSGGSSSRPKTSSASESRPADPSIPQYIPVATKITVKGGTIIRQTGNLIRIAEENLPKATFTAEDEELTGDIIANETSTIDVTLSRSTLAGKIQGAGLTMESGSSWNVTGDSVLTSLNNKEGISGNTVNNIIGNGHTVYYDKSANADLGGKTYNLTKGGKLAPKK